MTTSGSSGSEREFPHSALTGTSVKKVLFLAIDRISKRWSRPIKDWVAALNHFTIVFEERIPL